MVLSSLVSSLIELGERDARAALRRIEGLPAVERNDAGVALLRAQLLSGLGRTAEAREIVEELVQRVPGDADAHYLLGGLSADHGDDAAARCCFLRTLELDRSWALDWPEAERHDLLDEAARLCRETLRGLPERFRRELEAVPTIVELLPSVEQVDDGLDPRSLGVIEGDWHNERGSLHPSPLPTRIVLFAANLAADFQDPDEFAHQVRITVLHEVGHYFGLEEQDMERLGLE